MGRAGEVDADAIAHRVLRAYTECFLRRDIRSLRSLYVDRGAFVYFDNHAGCDSDTLADHLEKVERFLDTGDIVEVEVTILGSHVHGEAASVAGRMRYRSTDRRAAVRFSAFLERHDSSDWRIRHLHFSTDPNEPLSVPG